MKYQAYQACADMMAPMRLFMRAAVNALSHPSLIAYPGTRQLASACEMFLSTEITHARPDFHVTSVRVEDVRNAREVPVYEEAAHVAPFGTLVHFRKEDITGQPRVLIVAPMSGHFASRLRKTVLTMLTDHDVYITDWHNARDVPLAAGRFGLDDYLQYLITFLEVMGPGAHMMAICQACTSALAAAAIMAEDDHPAQPRSLALIAGPIDPRINPTAVNKFTACTPIEWFETNLIDTVPLWCAGAMRRVYPGFMQLPALMAMNPEPHIDFFTKMYSRLIEGDLEKTDRARRLYEENLAVLDLTAEFYLETIRHVFQDCALPLGKLEWHGRVVNPGAIRRTALLTIEGECDDICSIGQTMAAQQLCSSIPRRMRFRHMQARVGHDGIFSGRRWRERIYPIVRETIHVNQ